MPNSQILREVKKGETGRGLLIECDGHIVGDTDMIHQIKEDIEHHNKFVIPDRFIVPAIFQKYGIKNANGRIYPETPLKREVEKYINTKVRTRAAIGALDHPSCQLADTQILTKNGWKYISNVQVGEGILTITKDKNIEIKPILRKIDEPYKGKLIHFYGKMIDIKVTPNHRFPLLDSKYNFKGFYTAQEIFDGKVPDISNSYLFKTGTWKGVQDEYFILPSLDSDELSLVTDLQLKEKYSKEVKIRMDVWAKFMAIYLSLGNVLYRRNQYSGIINILIEKENILERVKEVLDDMPFTYAYKEYSDCDKLFSICDMRLAKYLEQFGNLCSRYIPYKIKKQSQETLKIFYEYFNMCKDSWYSNEIPSLSKKLVMDIIEIQLKIGHSASYNGVYPLCNESIEDFQFKGKCCDIIHVATIDKDDYIPLTTDYLTISEEEYDGRVYCVEVENHTFYTMCNNGCCFWSGNSSELSGKDVSHVITELNWQGKTLIGELELHLSPGYRKYGVCSTSGDLAANLILDGITIGVSSRAVGSVEEKMGVLIVGDDLELIGWDIVCEPSTPNAYIGKSLQDLQQFIETDTTKNDLSRVDERLERIKKILY